MNRGTYKLALNGGLLIIFWNLGFGKPHVQRTRRKSNSHSPPCLLWLIFFAITRATHPEEIKKPPEPLRNLYTGRNHISNVRSLIPRAQLLEICGRGGGDTNNKRGTRMKIREIVTTAALILVIIALSQVAAAADADVAYFTGCTAGFQ